VKQGDANSLRGVDDAEPPLKRRPVLAPARELAAAGAVEPNDPALGLLTQDSNLRPPGYEPDELPDCSTPQ
jgi:hypothetical protein